MQHRPPEGDVVAAMEAPVVVMRDVRHVEVMLDVRTAELEEHPRRILHAPVVVAMPCKLLEGDVAVVMEVSVEVCGLERSRLDRWRL